MCSKCKVNPPVSYHRYCISCINAYQRRYRRTPYLYQVVSKEGVYFGSTTSPSRWASHRNNAFRKGHSTYNCPLYQAIRAKCTFPSNVEDHFQFQVIKMFGSASEAHLIEQDLINEARLFKMPLYNSPNAKR